MYGSGKLLREDFLWSTLKSSRIRKYASNNGSPNLPNPIHPLLSDNFLFLDGDFGLGEVSEIPFV